jgi:hypothetical protein
MIQSRGRARFPVESLQAVGRRGVVAGKNLDRHVSTQACVAGPIHFAHSAGIDQREDFIGPETYSGLQYHAQGSPGASES